MNTFELDKTYVAPTYARFPLEIVSGEGCRVKDADGKTYIDLGTGIAVNIFGYNDEEWKAAVTSQLNKFQHTSNLFYSEPCARLAQLLCEKTGMKKVFFSNSGAEANECAIKAARKYAETKKGKDNYNIITLKNSFHGRTLATLAATGQDVFHADFLPVTPGFLYADANDIWNIDALLAKYRVAAIMIEVVQGEGGVMPLDKEYVLELAEIARRYDILLICDEVQCGNGRTGEMYGYMNYGIKPDIVTTAKGLGGGLPIGATLLGPKVEDVYKPGDHGSTFGGNPVVCAGACSIVSRLDRALFDSVKAKSKIIFDTLTGKPGIKSVSGLGFMIGVETEKDAGEVIAKCREGGVIVIKAKNKIRLLPPLNIDEDTLKAALDVIVAAAK